MSLKLLAYREISNNDKVIIFEIKILRKNPIWFKRPFEEIITKGFKEKKFSLCYYLDSNQIIHELYNSINAIIDSGLKEFTVSCEN